MTVSRATPRDRAIARMVASAEARDMVGSRRATRAGAGPGGAVASATLAKAWRAGDTMADMARTRGGSDMGGGAERDGDVSEAELGAGGAVVGA
eukprot:CAMPEP_0182530510 /NCGR_PEP_ID=MMETSP1323-20130603/5957_1 /TAXON_ID=236787 /ORGANISM="Florenciella parvula, Strain RCC1693" /LENGTH=93 /DNA_ID=CAMNT_0024739809 /DNA_START=176 /DNA_END=457 /DNA_ORIENTATION=-